MSEEGGERVPQAKETTYPLNSRRLTARSVLRIAEGLGLPTTASLADTRQMIEGRLIEKGHQPQNVEVHVIESEQGSSIRLNDEGGVILEIPREEESRGVTPTSEGELETAAGEEDQEREREATGGARGSGAEPSLEVFEELRAELESARSRSIRLEAELKRVQGLAAEETAQLQAEVSQLRERIGEDHTSKDKTKIQGVTHKERTGEYHTPKDKMKVQGVTHKEKEGESHTAEDNIAVGGVIHNRKVEDNHIVGDDMEVRRLKHKARTEENHITAHRNEDQAVAHKEDVEDVMRDKSANRKEQTTLSQNRSQSNTGVKESKTDTVKGQDLSDNKPSTGDDESGVASDDTVVPDLSEMCTLTDLYDSECDAVVPTQSVRLVRSVAIPPHQSVSVLIQTGIDRDSHGPLLVHPTGDIDKSTGVYMDDALVLPNQDGRSNVLVSNFTGFTQRLEEGDVLGQSVEVVSVESPSPVTPDSTPRAFVIDTVPKGESKTDEVSCVQQRQKRLRNVLPDPNLSHHEKETLFKFLIEHHDVFSLDEGERGETDLIQMEIDTGTATPKKQPARRLPFAVRQEVARQLEQMQIKGVIQPSKSPWASPVVLVKKKDGTHRFCIDYRRLNSVTKLDSFPLPRIEDLLDQLGRSKYFSTIDLASGFWQIQMHPTAQEKTAFVTHVGLFEFRVMPFGLTNAPAVFQRLMQQVVSPLNPRSGADFVSVYLDDILVYSRSLGEHLEHLKIVIQKLRGVGLKLQPTKCRFAHEELEYLGHVVSRDGLKTTSRLVSAVREFPVPRTVQDIRRFLGLASYYRRFIPGFAQIARPLHSLTCKDTRFVWSSECKRAFEVLKQKLTTSPVLAYPDFDQDFVLETDASVQGIGAVLGQYQDDHKLHPVAYASRALSAAEKHYGITELETLAVVWAITHFHHYLYGHTVTVFTDHTAVKAVLETANPTAKHARWWNRVYGRGIKKVNIVYRAGRENKNADALSRQPQLPAPEEGIAENEVQISTVTSGGGTMQEDRGVDTSSVAREKVEDEDPRVKTSTHLPAQLVEVNLPAAREELTEEVLDRSTESIGEKVQHPKHRLGSTQHLPAADNKLIGDNLPPGREELTGEEVLD